MAQFELPLEILAFMDKCRSACSDSGIEDSKEEITADYVIMCMRTVEARNLPHAFNIPDDYFRMCFNLDKKLLQDFVLRMFWYTGNVPESDTSRIPFDLRVLATFAYLVHGHLEHIKPLAAFKQYSSFRLLQCIPEVCRTIVLLLAPKFIKFPSSIKDVDRNKYCFQRRYGVPGVVGVLDCFRVPLSKIRSEHRESYTHRQEGTAVKVQVICNDDLSFLDVNSRFPAGKSDSYVWKRSHIRGIMQELHKEDRCTWLVADRGYRLENVVMNPYRNAHTYKQKAVNSALQQVQGVLDKAIAILKARFSCLNKTLPFSHQQCANIITTCVALHNYLIATGVPIEQYLGYAVLARNPLRNAYNEDETPEARFNRELLSEFIFKHERGLPALSICKETNAENESALEPGKDSVNSIIDLSA